jgi:hypothetical protein
MLYFGIYFYRDDVTWGSENLHAGVRQLQILLQCPFLFEPEYHTSLGIGVVSALRILNDFFFL